MPFSKQAQAIEDINEKLNRDLARQNRLFEADDIAARKKALEIKQQLKQERANARLETLSNSAAAISGEESAVYRTLASFQILVSSYSSAQKAFDALAGIHIVGPALSGIAAGLAVTEGFARVAAINDVQFADGGWTSGKRFQKGKGFESMQDLQKAFISFENNVVNKQGVSYGAIKCIVTCNSRTYFYNSKCEMYHPFSKFIIYSRLSNVTCADTACH